MSREAIQKCIDIAGGQTALVVCMRPFLPQGLACRFRQGHLSNWLNRERKSPVPPAEYVNAMSMAVNGSVTKYQLRSDLYDDPADNQEFL